MDRTEIARGLQFCETEAVRHEEESGLPSLQGLGYSLGITVERGGYYVNVYPTDTEGTGESFREALGTALAQPLLRRKRARLQRFELSDTEIDELREEFEGLMSEMPVEAFEALLGELEEIAVQMREPLRGSVDFSLKIGTMIREAELDFKHVQARFETDAGYENARFSVWKSPGASLNDLLDALEKVIAQAKKHIAQHGSSLKELSPGDQGNGLTLTEEGGFAWRGIVFDPEDGVLVHSRVEYGNVRYIAGLATITLSGTNTYVYVRREKRWYQSG